MPSINVTDDPEEYDEAVRAFRKRVPMPDWQWDALTEAEREFAFKVSGAAQADLVTDVWEAIDRALTDGTTLEDFKADVGPTLEAAWGREDPARIETIFRTNTQAAYNGGRGAIFADPEVRKARPFLRFDGVDDARQSEVCAALDGVVKPADDPFWGTHTPPLHFNAVVGDTLILTSVGWIRARDLLPWMQVLTHASQWRTVTAVLLKTVRREVLVLELSTGGVLLITKEHPVLVHTPANTLEWRKAGGLKAGDELLHYGHQAMRPQGASVADAKDAPALLDEPPIPGFIMEAPIAGRVSFPIHLYRERLGYESQIHDIGPHSEFGDGARAQHGEEILSCRSHRLAIELRFGERSARPGFERLGGVGRPHPFSVPPVDLRALSAFAPSPVALAAALRHHRRITASDSHLVGLGPHGDAVTLAPPRDDAIAELGIALEGAQAAALLPMPCSDQRFEGGSIREVEWHLTRIVSIVARPYYGDVVDLSVDCDETYVAGGVLVHNCRSIITPLSDEEAADEGVTANDPGVEADEGFGRQPSAGSTWEPDTSSYPAPIGNILRDRIR